MEDTPQVTEGAEEKWEQRWREECASVELPQWLQAVLPAPRPSLTLRWEADEFIVDGPEGEVARYGTFAEAYDAQKDSRENDLTLDPSVEGHGGRILGGSFMGAFGEGEKYARMFPLIPDSTHIAMLKHDYKDFLELHEKWETDQDNWALAYEWLQQHPASWKRPENARDDQWLSWDTQGGLSDLTHFVRVREGKPQWCFEYGSHVEPEYKGRYYDPRLDVEAPSFEEALVLLAKKVHKFFLPSGEEREGVEYEKSSMELELERIFAQLEEEEEAEEA